MTYRIKADLSSQLCQDCGHTTIWRCGECQKPTCAACHFGLIYALCQACRANFHGPIHALQSVGDRYTRAEFDRVFA